MAEEKIITQEEAATGNMLVHGAGQVPERDGEDEYGKTHYLTVDTFKPEPKKETTPKPEEDEDLPF